MNYMKYNRALVMLEEQNDGFCAKEGPVKGHLKVETGNGKGALRCTVQNLKYYPRGEYIYKLILFGKKGERTLHAIVGTLVVNRYGNSETYFRFNPVDVDARGSRYSDYFTAIVAAVSTRDATEPLHPVLKGLLENEEGEREPEHRLSAESLIKAAAAAPQPAAPKAETAKPKPEAQPKAETAAPKAAEPKPEAQPKAGDGQSLPESDVESQSASQSELRFAPQSAFQSAPQPAAPKAETAAPKAETAAPKAEAAAPKAEAAAPKAETAAPKAEAAEPKPEATQASQTWDDTHNYNGFYNEYLLNVCGYTCKVADYYEEVHPFDSDRTQARWKKVVNVENLPLVSPGAHHFAAQYRHYLFGARPGKDGLAERFYFGIPGRFLETEQPDGGRSGFTFWQPMRGADREKTAYGYWIVSVDAKTGNIEDV